ncbi:MAG TPA: uroporphyrinogen decarboxylase family protein [Aggregatilinea sp.]|uniref:uroporphyrinogen decarboxylase family protein n=1 Tax=Aggregatilinea sp. TaxID=2806333 RepID=UPI002BDFFC57|nr:uroporphyrinogen decarboxylase family protein [Aggregatilinea sp.]HML20129.1 uroporphyrinogen decarboxylase family protein [Aggregatilinea sp.]
MSKRERLEKTIAGEETDRVPIALWRHWPGDDQRPIDLAEATVAFQRRWDFDFVKVSPSSSYCITDYGVQDKWVGHIEGTREYVRRAVTRSLDWTDLRVLDPSKGALGRQLETLRLLNDAFGTETPFIMTIFSPLAQAKNIAGRELLIEHMRTSPDRVKTGLNTITESTLRFIEAIRRSGVAGIFYAIQHASFSVMSQAEYETFGRPYDLRILEALPDDWWLNMAHLHGTAPMFDLIADYPVQILNWHDREAEPDLANGKLKFKGAVSGGIGRMDPMHTGTPVEVRAQARKAIEETGARRLVLSTGCVIMTTTPQSNIRAARETVESLV